MKYTAVTMLIGSSSAVKLQAEFISNLLGDYFGNGCSFGAPSYGHGYCYDEQPCVSTQGNQYHFTPSTTLNDQQSIAGTNQSNFCYQPFNSEDLDKGTNIYKSEGLCFDEGEDNLCLIDKDVTQNARTISYAPVDITVEKDNSCSGPNQAQLLNSYSGAWNQCYQNNALMGTANHYCPPPCYNQQQCGYP